VLLWRLIKPAILVALLALCGCFKAEGAPTNDLDTQSYIESALIASAASDTTDKNIVRGLIWMKDEDPEELWRRFNTYGEYLFQIYERGTTVAVCGREPASDGQNVYVVIAGAYFEYNGDDLSWLLNNSCFELISDANPVPVPVSNAEVIGEFGWFEWHANYLRFHFREKFSGNCRLRVKVKEGEPVTLNLGIADKSFFRKAVITNSAGLSLRAKPSLKSSVLKQLKYGNEILMTGNETYYAKGIDDIEDTVQFAEVRYKGEVGWIMWLDIKKDKTFIKVIGFETF